MAGPRGRRRAAAAAAAPLHPGNRPQHQWRPALGKPRVRDGAAVRARQVRGRGLDGDARGEEGRADPYVPVRPAAVPRGARTARRVDLPRAQPLDGRAGHAARGGGAVHRWDRKSTRLNSSHGYISYAVFCLKKKNKNQPYTPDFGRNARAHAGTQVTSASRMPSSGCTKTITRFERHSSMSLLYDVRADM